ncbi:hypothetical protein DNH61_25835 [Paenibacillus sambharensis]|uniref:DUF3139 domain-containing protein n=1 Tax=Paenibacillus sambharensis TaxID=1803190 RepID=A0A2W1L204_9BACL|nr:DUF3139 domain-containing protein [Paenibacillus sambharensis]PZD92919.1 hypothetical protein DNH61_25835 [Paenibacillus sambharensis]
MSKRKMILAGVGMIVLLLVSSIFLKLERLERKVENYLYSTRGYSAESIKQVEAQLSKVPGILVEVIFADEPKVKYLYGEDDNKSVIQYGHTNTGANYYKHSELGY